MAPEPPAARAPGFTLLEVLVALIIFALAFGVLAQMMQTGLRQSRAAETTTAAILLARSLLTEAGVTAPLTPGVQEGEADPDFRWRTEIQPSDVAPADDAFMLYLVRVTVAWGEPARGQEVALSSLRIGPPP